MNNYVVKIYNINHEIFIYIVKESDNKREAINRALMQYKYGTNNIKVNKVVVL